MIKIYSVGGSVRDHILGLNPKDHDYVVVGSTPEEMIAKGYTQVGSDFPVFHHPVTKDEYALARTERKSGVGYGGFSTDIRNVTLEDDLLRRDLTMNAIAMSESGSIIDPHGGINDIKAKKFRHVSEAFREDPLRVLRVARFRARYGVDWSIDPGTYAMMSEMVNTGEVDTVTQERVWVEFEKGLMEPHPELMLGLLSELGLLKRPAFSSYASGEHPSLEALGSAVSRNEPARVRCVLAFPEIGHHAQKGKDKVPSDIKQIAFNLRLAVQGGMLNYIDMSAQSKLDLLLKVDAIRQGARFDAILSALDCITPKSSDAIRIDLNCIKSMDRASIIGCETDGLTIKDLIYQAMINALEDVGDNIPKKSHAIKP